MYVLDSHLLPLILYLVLLEGRVLDLCLCGLFIQSSQGAPKPNSSWVDTDLLWIQSVTLCMSSNHMCISLLCVQYLTNVTRMCNQVYCAVLNAQKFLIQFYTQIRYFKDPHAMLV